MRGRRAEKYAVATCTLQEHSTPQPIVCRVRLHMQSRLDLGQLDPRKECRARAAGVAARLQRRLRLRGTW